MNASIQDGSARARTWSHIFMRQNDESTATRTINRQLSSESYAERKPFFLFLSLNHVFLRRMTRNMECARRRNRGIWAILVLAVPSSKKAATGV
jgi:hypothetical protein